MTKRILYIMAVTALLPLSRTYAQTEPPAAPAETNNVPEWHKMTPEQRFEHFSSKLNLSTEQEPKVKAVFDQWRATMKEAKTNAETQLQSILTAEQFQKFKEMMEHKKHMHWHGGMEGGTNEDQNQQ